MNLFLPDDNFYNKRFLMSYNIRAFKDYNMKKTNKQTNILHVSVASLEFLKMAPFSTSSVILRQPATITIVSLRQRNAIQSSPSRSIGIICQQFGHESYETYREQCTLSKTRSCFFACVQEKI